MSEVSEVLEVSEVSEVSEGSHFRGGEWAVSDSCAPPEAAA